MNNGEIAYDGDNPFNIEIVSKNILDFYSKNNDIEKYPYRFFILKINLRFLILVLCIDLTILMELFLFHQVELV